MSETDAKWTDLCALDEVPTEPDKGGKYVAVDNRGLAVFRQGGGVLVIDNACPHAGGSMAGGYIDEGCVFCPWHHWAFSTEDGRCPDNPRVRVPKHPARVVDGRVQAQLPTDPG